MTITGQFARNNSLRQRLLLSLLPGLILAVLLAATASYTLVTRPMREAFDQSLADTAVALIPYIREEQGQIIVHLSSQAERILRADEFETVSFAVFGPAGQFIAGDKQLSSVIEQVNRPGRTQPGNSAMARSFYDLKVSDANVRVLLAPVQLEHLQARVIVAETTRKRRQRDIELVFGLLAPLGFLAIATAMTVWWGTRRGLDPLHHLAEQLGQRSMDNLTSLEERGIVQELRPLIHAINDLLQRLDRARNEQGRFIADAAHQLRTPLASLSMLLELAAAEQGEAGAARIKQARQAAQRTIHLAQQLLTLSAVQSESAAHTEASTFELTELVLELAPAWALRAEQLNSECTFNLEARQVSGQRTMIGEAINNLVDNALIYSGPGALITVSCGALANGTQSFLEISDNGPGIAQAHRENIFKRFYRPPGSPGTGSGLGLAIVQAVAQSNGLVLELMNAEPRGLRVRLVFPAAAPAGEIPATQAGASAPR